MRSLVLVLGVIVGIDGLLPLPGAPSAPVVVNASSKTVQLEWELDTEENHGAPIDSYEIQQWRLGDSVWQSAASHHIGELHYFKNVTAVYLDVRVDAGARVKTGSFELEYLGEAIMSQISASNNARITWPIAFDANGATIAAALEALDGVASARAWRCDAVRRSSAGWLTGCAYGSRGGYSWRIELETTSSLQLPLAVYRYNIDGIWTGPGPMVIVRRAGQARTHRLECGITEWIGAKRHAPPQIPRCTVSVLGLLPNSVYAFRLAAVSAVGASSPGPASRYARTLPSEELTRPPTPPAPRLFGKNGDTLLFHVATPFSYDANKANTDYYELQTRQENDDTWINAGSVRLDASGFATARVSNTTALRSRAVSEKYQLRSEWSRSSLVSSSKTVASSLNQITVTAEALDHDSAAMIRWLPKDSRDQSYELAWQREESATWQITKENISAIKVHAVRNEVQVIESRVPVHEAGGFRLALDGRATSTLSWDAVPNEMVLALSKVASSKDKIQVTRRTAAKYGDSVMTWRVTFIDALQGRKTPFPLLSIYSTTSTKRNPISIRRTVAATPAVFADVLETVVRDLQPLTRYRFRVRTTDNVWSVPSNYIRTAAASIVINQDTAVLPARKLVLEVASGREAARNSDPDYALGVGLGGIDGKDGTDGAAILSIYDDDDRSQAQAVYLKASRTPRRYVVPPLGSHRGTTLRLVAKLWGAGGGGGTLHIPPGSTVANASTFGGGGGFAQASFAVVAGETLEVFVGSGGRGAFADAPGAGGERGGNYGGRATDRAGAGGGGATELKRRETLLLSAGGGGGSGSKLMKDTCTPNGGAGGGSAGAQCVIDDSEKVAAPELIVRNEDGVSVPFLSPEDDYLGTAGVGESHRGGRGASGFTAAGGGGGGGHPGGNGGAPGCGGDGGKNYVDGSRLSLTGSDANAAAATTPTILQVDHSSVKLAVTSEPSLSTIGQYEIEMALEAVSEAFSRVALSSSGTFEIDALQPATSYLFRARYLNRSWISEPSESISVTTRVAPSDSWSRVKTRGKTPSARRGHSLTRLFGGNVTAFSTFDQSLCLVFGGFGDGYECDSPVGATFRLGSPSAGRDVQRCFVRGGASNELWLLDTALWSWSQMMPYENQSWPGPRAHHVAADINGRLLVWGGRVDADPPASAGSEPVPLVDLWELDLLRRPERHDFDWNNATENFTALARKTTYFTIQVPDLNGQCLRDLDVKLRLSCSDALFDIDLIGPNDNQADSDGQPLMISVPLVGPSSTGNALCDDELFFDDESISVTERPLGKLSRFRHLLPGGMWTLRIRDKTAADISLLNSTNSSQLSAWRLQMLTEPCERSARWTNLSESSRGDAPPWLLDPIGVVVNASLFISGRRAGDAIGDTMPLWRYDRNDNMWSKLLASTVSAVHGRAAGLTPYGLFSLGGILKDGPDGRLLRVADLREPKWEKHFDDRGLAVLPADYRLDGDALRESRFLQAKLASLSAPRARAYSALTYIEAGIADRLEYDDAPPMLILFGGDDDVTILDDLWKFELANTSTRHVDNDASTSHAALCDWRFVHSGGAQTTWDESCGSSSSLLSSCSLSDLLIRAFCMNQSQSINHWPLRYS